MSVLVLCLCLSYAVRPFLPATSVSFYPTLSILILLVLFHPFMFSPPCLLKPFSNLSFLISLPSPFFLVFPIFFICVVYVVLSHLILSFPVILYRSCYAFCILLSCPSFLLCPVLFVSSFPILPVLSCPDDHFLHPYAFLYYSTFPVLSILSFPVLSCHVIPVVFCHIVFYHVLSYFVLFVLRIFLLGVQDNILQFPSYDYF